MLFVDGARCITCHCLPQCLSQVQFVHDLYAMSAVCVRCLLSSKLPMLSSLVCCIRPSCALLFVAGPGTCCLVPHVRVHMQCSCVCVTSCTLRCDDAYVVRTTCMQFGKCSCWFIITHCPYVGVAGCVPVIMPTWLAGACPERMCMHCTL